MDVSWDEAEATIEAKKKPPLSERSATRDPNSSHSATRDLNSSHPPRTQGPTREENSGNGKFELKTVVIDPGHGGRDPGAVRRGVKEKQLVLDVSLRLAELIDSKSELKAVLTRNSDEYLTLSRRTEIANQYPAGSTLFISIHCNADRSSLGRGLETFVFDLEATDAEAAALAKRENADQKMDLAYILSYCYHVGNEPYSLEAAKRIQTSLVKRLRLRNRSVKRAPFYVLAGTKMPAILVELGFISNYYDRKKLQSASFRQSAAEAIFEMIRDFNKDTRLSLSLNVKS
jgi:N-acetylmuramoyl-L-alanine amidase